ncbi:nicotinate-nucleotide adenylyltransferase [Irregularibacter muris]|uniref:Probable nicotinate-nucleotide adenylyltransferase n=1 Tax=Irregularibacter muris TaxID=1796619 RepID=A0AAE3HK30_9FIRM|nr:nicotinate-nucleotide adenylyltransferase [Irregularibacter muris]MCR1900229.1 nicotinate-nucleotide adenylyltransferase [Irregularibacter muris]
MAYLKENKEKPEKIGILGGTFDPIHYGHLVIAQWAKEEFSLDKVLFVPAGTPPHKLHKEVLMGKHRYRMTTLATNTNPNFKVSSMEMNRLGPSYTIDTIKDLRKEYGKDTFLYFITGADSVLDFYTWKDYEELIKSCYFIAATREGYDVEKFNQRIEEIHELFGHRIFKMDIPDLDISSTNLRKRINQGKSVKYLLPETVEQYIIENKLYKDLKG